MKSIIMVLIVLLCALQYKLWLANGSIPQVIAMKQDIKEQTTRNLKLEDRNQALDAEVKELKLGTDSLEENARNELGMVKEGEEFYQIIEQGSNNP